MSVITLTCSGTLWPATGNDFVYVFVKAVRAHTVLCTGCCTSGRSRPVRRKSAPLVTAPPPLVVPNSTRCCVCGSTQAINGVNGLCPAACQFEGNVYATAYDGGTGFGEGGNAA